MNLELLLDNRIIKGWTKAKVKYSLNTLAACAIIYMVDDWNSSLNLKANSDVTLKYDDRVILTGKLVKRNTIMDGNIHEVSWEIRSSSSILAKSDMIPPASQIDGITLKAVLQNLVKNYNIPIEFNATDISLPFLNLNYGDSIGTIIEKLCREAKLIYAPTTNGGIKIFNTDIGSNAGTLIFHNLDMGKSISTNNIIGAKTCMSVANRYNIYYVDGQHTPIEGEALDDAYSSIFKTVDKEVNDNSSLCIFADDGANLENYGIIERSRRIKDSIIIEYALKIKTKANGKLWEVGDIVTVDDDVNDVYGNFIISSVTLGLNNTTECWVSLSPPEAFILKDVTNENQYGNKKTYKCPSFFD